MSNFLIILIGLVLLLCFVLGARSFLEPQQPEQTEYELPGPSDSPTLRAIFFSDYHYPLNHLPLEYLYSFILAKAPDLVVFGGDMGNGERDLEGAYFITGRIAAFCRDKGIPFVAIRGNHDEGLDPVIAAQTGYPLLVNEHFNVQAEDGLWWQVLGLEDIRLGRADTAAALAKKSAFSSDLPAGEEVPPSRRILLAHNPDAILALDHEMGAFCLSGHFHGGQIRLPFHLEFTMLRSEVLCRLGFTDGAHPIHGICHFISRGYGSVLFPNRLGVKPEVSHLIFHETLPQDSQANDLKIQTYIEDNELTPLV